MRVKFKKGKQREFLKKILKNLNCPSLHSLNQFGFNIPYSTLKNYFSEDRTLPKEFFTDLCYLAKLDENKFEVKFLEEHFGQILGGKNKYHKTCE